MKSNRQPMKSLKLLPAILVSLSALAGAQEMTERHIPVGAYTYMASKYLSTGTIAGVNRAARTLTLKVGESERSFRLTETTMIWLDRSHFGQTTVDGKPEDLANGLRAEVRAAGPERPDVAYWVKVKMLAP